MDIRRAFLVMTLGCVAAPLALSCSATGGTRDFAGETAGTQGSGSGGSGVGSAGSVVSAGNGGAGGEDIFTDGGFATSGGGGSGPIDDCSEEAKLVYIIGEDNELYSFYPPTLEVKLIGVIKCASGLFATPFSMAVDRKGIAWILFNDGKIYHVDVKDASCTPTNFVAGQQGMQTFGMGFVSNKPGSAEETLYVADYIGTGLAQIDTTTLTLTKVGGWDKLSGAAELTGTGDARLFGFFNGSPIIIAEIDKSSAKILSQAPQPTVNIGSGWAFAFWGGDFWLFTSPTGESQIDQYKPKDGTTTTVKTGLGTNIVGAGVSTCAPVVYVPK
jgi:hypothetical protein